MRRPPRRLGLVRDPRRGWSEGEQPLRSGRRDQRATARPRAVLGQRAEARHPCTAAQGLRAPRARPARAPRGRDAGAPGAALLEALDRRVRRVAGDHGPAGSGAAAPAPRRGGLAVRAGGGGRDRPCRDLAESDRPRGARGHRVGRDPRPCASAPARPRAGRAVTRRAGGDARRHAAAGGRGRVDPRSRPRGGAVACGGG